jgi:hypothetical protein
VGMPEVDMWASGQMVSMVTVVLKRHFLQILTVFCFRFWYTDCCYPISSVWPVARCDPLN